MSKEKKHVSFRQQFKIDQTRTIAKKRRWGLLLIPIFLFVLFMTCYFNYTSGFAFNPDGTTLGTRFYLSGPDPYYNMRLVEQTMQTGSYPFTQPHSVGGADPLLNYPVGERGARPPLFNMMAVASTSLLQNFMTQIDAQGWSMLFLPAIYGALMVFPLFYIGKELFNRKVGLIAAMLLPLIPTFVGGGHGAGFSLFDHDSFIQLLFILVIYFVIKMIRASSLKRSLVYASFAGLFSGSIYLTWVASQMIYLVLLVGMLSILVFSLLRQKDEMKTFLGFLMLSVVAFFVGLPWSITTGDVIGFPLFMIGVSAFLLCLCFITKRINIPWVVSIPSLTIAGFGSLIMLYLVNIGWVYLGGRIYQMSIFFFGEGIYGSKISLTIAEAHTISLSGSVMSIGPFVYWLGLVGFCLYIVKSYRDKFQAENVFMISLFFVLLWLLTTAGRFLNDLIPYIVLFCAWMLLVIVDKIGLKKLREPISALGFFRGMKRGMSPIRILGVIFIVVMLLSNSFLALDAAVPQVDKERVFGENFSGYFGQSLGQSYYWSDACAWLAGQDLDVASDGEKPGVISWWDYGFYLSSQSKHPTVADNYQDGIPPASNFHTAKNEQEAVCVLIVRCIEGACFRSGYKIPDDIKTIIRQHLPVENRTSFNEELNTTVKHLVFPAEDFIRYFEDPVKYAPSYDQLIHPEYGNRQLKIKADNARYQDCCKLMMNLTDDQITEFYMDVKQITGFDIRYYAVEQYDTQIFNVFSFLADKSTFGFVDYEDDYMYTYYETPTGEVYFVDQLANLSQETLSTLIPKNNYKPAYFETMFYRAYYGTNTTRAPGYLLKHFAVVYSSPYVIIMKYSEGARVSGSVGFASGVSANMSTYPNFMAVAFDQYGIPHDYMYVDFNGTYSLLLPEGNCSIGLMLGDHAVNASRRIQVDMDEARRLVDHTVAENITVGLSNVAIDISTNQTDLWFSMQGQYFGGIYTSPVFSNDFSSLVNVFPDSYDIQLLYTNNTVYYQTTQFIDTGNNTILLNK